MRRRGFSGSGQSGQVIIMATFALVLLCGMLGLVVDLGWAYFTRKSAQLAADSASLAAVRKARVGTPSDSMACGLNGVSCAPAPLDCSSISGGNLQSACLYAARAGFSSNALQTVTVQASDRTTAPTVAEACGQGGATVRHPPTAGCVDTYYWVTTRVSRRIPQLFSAVLGNTQITASARATAAMADYVSSGDLWALNRQFETPVVGRGEMGNDIYVWGNSEIHAGGIVLASNAYTHSKDSDEAGVIGGAGHVYGNTSIRGDGWVSDETKFEPPPVNGFADLPIFDDPMRGKGQPPAPTGLPSMPILSGSLTGNCSAPPVYPPGSYYAVNSSGAATGGPITINGCVTFSGGGAGGFGNYVFFGGLNLGSSTVTFNPGRYFLAGSMTDTILSLPNNAIMQDNTPLVGGDSVRNTDAGEIFVFTDANYPGLQVPAALAAVRNSLDFGQIYIQSGNKFEMNLHGLNADHASVPDDLKTFAPTVFWQDQRNSPVRYTDNGYVDYTSCGGGHSLDSPCTNSDPTIVPGMILQASPKLQLYGLIYQPRGAGIEFQGNAHIRAPMQVITGSVSLQGGNTLELERVGNPLRRRVVALVE